MLVILLATASIVFFKIFDKPKKQHIQINSVFEQPGVLIIKNAKNVKFIKVYNHNGNLIAQAKGYNQSIIEVRFPWVSKEMYRIVSDDGLDMNLSAPDKVPIFLIKIHAPLGQKPYQFIFNEGDTRISTKDIILPASSGEVVNIMLEIEKLADNKERVFQVFGEVSENKSENLVMNPEFHGNEHKLLFEFDKVIMTSRLQISKPGGSISFNIKNGNFELPIKIKIIDSHLKEDSIVLERWLLPTDSYGLFDSKYAVDQINMPNPFWNKVMPWFGVKPKSINFWEPFTHQTLVIRNKNDYPITLLFSSMVLDINTDKQSSYFQSPSIEATGGTDQIISYIQIKAQSKSYCVLPVYVAKDTPAGTYNRRVTITPLGSNRVIKTLESPINVIRSNPLFTAWMALTTILSLLWGGIIFIFYRKLIRSLGVRNMVLLSLLGSMKFCLQFAGGLVSNVLHAFLGPFNILVGGLLTEVMTYLVITAIIFLVPRVGAMTLAGMVSYLMSGILFGSFTLTNFIMIINTIAFREILLYIFGITRGNSWHKNPKIIPLMLALGIADAASGFTSLTLNTFFYRMFYAEWYIFLQVIVTGFCYTALGVYLGKSLGLSLRKVQL